MRSTTSDSRSDLGMLYHQTKGGFGSLANFCILQQQLQNLNSNQNLEVNSMGGGIDLGYDLEDVGSI